MSLSAQNVTKGNEATKFGRLFRRVTRAQDAVCEFPAWDSPRERQSFNLLLLFFFSLFFFARGSALSTPDLSIHLYRLFGEPTQKPVWWCVDIRLERLNNDRSCGFLLASPFPFHRSLFLSQNVCVYIYIMPLAKCL